MTISVGVATLVVEHGVLSHPTRVALLNAATAAMYAAKTAGRNRALHASQLN